MKEEKGKENKNTSWKKDRGKRKILHILLEEVGHCGCIFVTEHHNKMPREVLKVKY